VSKDKIALVTSSRESMHYTPFPKPHLEAFETPLRTQMAHRYLSESGALNAVTQLSAPKASTEDVLLVHTPYLLDTIHLMTEIGTGQLGESAYASEDLVNSALSAVGGAKRATKAILTKDARHAFALVRPPGHHATRSNPMGLCFFNNAAIATVMALMDDSIEKVTILDIDDHHGNGTSEIFYSDPNVQYISIHEYDYENFGTGHFTEIGWGEGQGTNVNIPLVEASPDVSYRHALDRVVKPAVERFRPNLIIVSAGYDAHYADPVGNMNVDSRTFWHIGREVNRIVGSLGSAGSVWILEGGYNPLSLGPCIRASLEGLSECDCPKLEDQIDREENDLVTESNEEVIEKVLEALEPYW
jgi:acetoin utilization deacetylase AcuC-like enzyme